ncbi:MAG: molybdopterin synthase catalytic subunit MoaE [Chromatiaceae bacterium]|jgi:molybdopterin synthase catalytic subunit
MASTIPVTIEITAEPLDLAAETATFQAGDPATGAVATFTGLMRDSNEGDRVAAMTLEHYPGMTEKALQRISDEATERWSLLGVRIVHRVGDLRPTDPIVFVAVASAHRGDAFAACEFLMDYLKTQAPFWKRETLVGGTDRWVAARDSDTQAAERWAGDDRNAARPDAAD